MKLLVNAVPRDRYLSPEERTAFTKAQAKCRLKLRITKPLEKGEHWAELGPEHRNPEQRRQRLTVLRWCERCGAVHSTLGYEIIE